MTRFAALLLSAVAALPGGCAALSNPVADAVPVRQLPAEVLGRPIADYRPVPLTLLRQKEPDAYRLDRGDVLAVVADDVIAPADRPAPVQLNTDGGNRAAVGYPVPVRDDGTISLPRLAPIPVRGQTLAEVETLIGEYATGKRGGVELVKPAALRVSVQLLQKRTYEVLVIREDAAQAVLGSGGGGASLGYGGGPVVGAVEKSYGFTLRLPAYENDVLRALVATGGLPGFESEDEVLVLRDARGLPTAEAKQHAARIPLRAYPETPVTIREDDVILRDGDVLYIPARANEVFYTAGLLGGGQYLLPRGYDLDVLQAVMLVRGPVLNGGFSQNGLVGASVQSGLGFPSPSLLTVLRKLPDGRQVPIRVHLDRAFRDPRERLLLKPGDILVMQERPGDAVGRYLTNTFQFTTVIESIRGASITQDLVGVNP